MEQMHWWKEDKYWHRGEACRNESDTPLFLEMIHEATRLGIQQGKREAWTETLELMYEARDMGLSDTDVREKIEAKLSSLSNSSKDKV